MIFWRCCFSWEGKGWWLFADFLTRIRSILWPFAYIKYGTEIRDTRPVYVVHGSFERCQFLVVTIYIFVVSDHFSVMNLYCFDLYRWLLNYWLLVQSSVLFLYSRKLINNDIAMVDGAQTAYGFTC